MLLAAAFLCAAPAFHDGDNIRCQGRKAMRLAGIDAPELADSPKCRRLPRPRGAMCDDRRARASRDHLAQLAAGKAVTCQVVDANPRMKGFQRADRYGRPVVRCAAGDIDLGRAQIAAGMARRWE